MFVFLDAIEEEEDDGLEGGYDELLVALRELCLELTVCESVFKLKLST